MSDLIGLRIECRFIKDEASIYKKLKEIFYIEDIDGYFYSDYSKNIKLKINETQPQKQHNGFDIYKIDGKFETNSSKYHFELQIKSFVNIFWEILTIEFYIKTTLMLLLKSLLER